MGNYREQVSYSGLGTFIFKNPDNKWFVRVGILSVLIQFSIFKFFYPHAGFINGDSYVYLETAYHNLTVNVYPIGYSKLLRLISVFTRFDNAVVAFQYFFLQASILSFVFTVFYFYNPGKLTKIVLFSFILFNPVFLYLANYISSDSFFLALSFVWFTLLLWMMKTPSIKLVLINSIVLFLAFTVRYNALFYPVIGIVALLLTKRGVMVNLLGFVVSMVFIGLFIGSTSTKYKEISGYAQFSPFTGWQVANNALYAYRYVDSSHRKDVPIRLQQIDKVVRAYFDSSRDVRNHPDERLVASTVYMWAPNSPLNVYMENQFKGDSVASSVKKWATVAPLMQEYGSFLIHTYPKEFAKYYLIPNAIKYYAPPVEFLNQYSTGVDSVNQIAQVWFGYKTKKLTIFFKDFKVHTLDFYPILTGTMNVTLVLSMLSFFLLGGHRQHTELNRGLVLVVSLWAVNFGFSVFASPIALRFQLFPILVSTSFTFLLIEYLIKTARKPVTDGGRIANDSIDDQSTQQEIHILKY
ncbi:hypothetical protein HGH93_29695 [Chitinophaga polysaccharea]|uniref:hypothetical protein n=1 Tax=Chitinophaga polysaccharea TaxID=1293035 RepID=UPI001455399A|nr:hypothetical protein [Chitinophaga polysaccharea]NLR62302.1 hypothetical protein [Chitinophaga polysaccharea]